MRDVYIVGVGQTAVSRDATRLERELAANAVGEALGDANADPAEIDALFVGNMMGGVLSRQQQLGALIADYSGLGGIEAATVEAACASGAAAARTAYLMLTAGVHDVAVVCGVERMSHAEKSDVTAALATAADWELESRRGESFLSLNATLMSEYITTYRVARDAFANFSITAHANAERNANAVFRQRIDADAYCASRTVIEPLKLYDVSPICNGAAAIVIAAGDAARHLLDGRPAVRIVASSAATAPVALDRRSQRLHLGAVATSTEAVLRDAGVSRDEIDFVELHDAYTIMTALSLEAAGFAAPGTGTRFATENRIGLEGDLPVGTFGGLKARGHPVGATGVYQLAEAYLQLTESAGSNQVAAAEIGLTQNIGGTGSTVVNHILRRTG